MAVPNATNNNEHSPIRVGILGCASIARKVARAILHSESQCTLTALASRSRDKAAVFAEDHIVQASDNSISMSDLTLFGGENAYQELIDSNDIVDALYIPLPTALHKQWVLPTLQAGKHVLLEKPVALSVQEWEEFVKAAKENSCYIQDGTMFVHHPRTALIQEMVSNSDELGLFQRLESGFTFYAPEEVFQDNIRSQASLDALGCVGDLAWYQIRAALLWAGSFGSSASETSEEDSSKNNIVSVQVIDWKVNSQGVPIDVTYILKFRNHRTAMFHCGFGAHFRQYMRIVGTRKGVLLEDFVLPKDDPVHYRLESMSLTDYDLLAQHDCQTVACPNEPVQEVLLWKHFAQSARIVESFGWQSKEAGEARQLLVMTTNNQTIVDAVMRSIQSEDSKIVTI